MILIDPRVGSKELLLHIQRLKIPVELSPLAYGDACFDGNGPRGPMSIGIERKALGDMLHCIDDARYAAYQRPGMAKLYNYSLLIIEGIWKPDYDTGYLLDLIATMTWRPYRYRSQMVRYSKLFRYILSLQLSGQPVIITRDLEHTAYNIVECYHYFSKKWDNHTSLREIQKYPLAEVGGAPSLVRKCAAQVDGLGVKISSEVDKHFGSLYDMSSADELSWVKIPGISVRLARRIVKEIRGW